MMTSAKDGERRKKKDPITIRFPFQGSLPPILDHEKDLIFIGFYGKKNTGLHPRFRASHHWISRFFFRKRHNSTLIIMACRKKGRNGN